MFEQLDDPNGFDPAQSFFAETSRRFAVRRRRTAAARAVVGMVGVASVVPAFLAARTSDQVDETRPVEGSAVSKPVAGSMSQHSTPPGSEPVQTLPSTDASPTNFLIV